jgi:hypothetical protein
MVLPETNDPEGFSEGFLKVEHDVLSRLGGSVDPHFEGTPEQFQEVRTNLICQWWNDEMAALGHLFEAQAENVLNSEISTLYARERILIAFFSDVLSVENH